MVAKMPEIVSKEAGQGGAQVRMWRLQGLQGSVPLPPPPWVTSSGLVPSLRGCYTSSTHAMCAAPSASVCARTASADSG
jgi:hypothetical protein